MSARSHPGNHGPAGPGGSHRARHTVCHVARCTVRQVARHSSRLGAVRKVDERRLDKAKIGEKAQFTGCK